MTQGVQKSEVGRTETCIGNREGRRAPDPAPAGIAGEQHYTPQELGQLWNVDANTIRRMFADEDGVLVFGNTETRKRRRYMSMRIPTSVAARVHRRLHERQQY